MELLREDLKWCLRLLPKSLFKLMKKRYNDIALAGGYIRSRITNEKPSDIDMFSNSKDLANICALIISKDTNGEIIETDNAFTVKGKIPIQFIHRWVYKKPPDVLPSFDFTIAKAVIWFNGKQWKSLCDDRYYAHLAAKKLVYCSPKRIEEVGGSMLRVLKFYQRGYRIPLDSFGAVIARIVSKIDFNRINTEEDLAKTFTGLLREVDPDIDPTHIAHLPSTKETDGASK